MTDDSTRKQTFELLLRAVARINAAVQQVPAGPWKSLDDGDRLVSTNPDGTFTHVVEEPIDGPTSRYIAMWGPNVAAEISDYLKSTAFDIHQGHRRTSYSAVRIAHEILSGPDGVAHDPPKEARGA